MAGHLCSKSYLQHQLLESGHYQDQLIEVNELTLTAWQKTDLWLWLVNITDQIWKQSNTTGLFSLCFGPAGFLLTVLPSQYRPCKTGRRPPLQHCRPLPGAFRLTNSTTDFSTSPYFPLLPVPAGGFCYFIPTIFYHISNFYRSSDLISTVITGMYNSWHY